MEGRVFISYSNKDESSVRELVQRLESELGVQAWYYSRDQDSRLPYLLQIKQQIDNALAVIVVLSEHSAESKTVLKELLHAEKKRRVIVPVVIAKTTGPVTTDLEDTVVGLQLTDLNWIDGRRERDPLPDISKNLQELPTYIGTSEKVKKVRPWWILPTLTALIVGGLISFPSYTFGRVSAQPEITNIQATSIARQTLLDQQLNVISTQQTVAQALSATIAALPQPGRILRQVLANKKLRCGIEGSLPGFSDGVEQEIKGFDADFCRAVAAAIFGSSEGYVEFVRLDTKDRFEAIETGRIDVLFRTTTATAERVTNYNITFGPTIYHDSQLIMIRTREYAQAKSLVDLQNSRICVLKESTTSFANIALELDMLKRRGLNPSIELVTQDRTGVEFVNTTDAFDGFFSRGECNAITSDSAQLIARRSQQPDKDLFSFIPLTVDPLRSALYRQPLAPVYIGNDDMWRKVIDTVVYTLIYAEELNIRQGNLATINDADRRIQAFLYGNVDEGQMKVRLDGLEKDFVSRIIKDVGNYQDIYERNISPLYSTEESDNRGPNKAWNQGEGGLLYAIPWVPENRVATPTP